MEELENRGIVELLFEDNSQGDKVFRFVQNFMRETLFGIQVYDKQRKPTHLKFIAYLQENMVLNWQTNVKFYDLS